LNPRRALIVDDEVPLCEVLSDLLDLEGFQVTVCHDIASARERLAESEFDIALLDVFLTDEPLGLTLGREIVAEHQATGLVFMTGFADEADIQAGFSFGAYGCIRKPFALDDVIRIVSMAMEKPCDDCAA
jgi:two-component system, OmpR family, response regulator CpxR